MEPVKLYQWVNDNNPRDDAQYGKDWWDYIDFLYRLDELDGPNQTTVVSTYHMTTPPPSEVLFMPVARLETEHAVFVMRERFDLNHRAEMDRQRYTQRHHAHPAIRPDRRTGRGDGR